MDPARHLRQILLAEIGELGQQRIARATAQVLGSGPEHAIAALYAERAGFASLAPAPSVARSHDDDRVIRTPAARDVLDGARLALAEMRRAVGMEPGP